MKKLLILILCSAFTFGNLFAQLRVSTGTQLNTTSNTTITTDANFTNQSSATNLTNVELHLVGISQQLSTINPIEIKAVVINSGGSRTFTSGDWIFLNSMTFTDGILTTLNSARIIYKGSEALSGNTASYVNGFFHNEGSGTRYFPIGITGLFAPTQIDEGASTLLGMRVVSGGLSIDPLPAEINELLSSHHWELLSPNGDIPGSPVALSTDNLGSLDGASDLVVVYKDPVSNTGLNLGGIPSSNFIKSQQGAMDGLFTIGRGEKINLLIHDMISPFNKDGVNDVLVIDNIELTETNKVSLMDRYGTVIKEWTDYHLHDPGSTTAFDFSNLPPGNYICVLEYKLLGGSSTEKISQMVTILQTN